MCYIRMYSLVRSSIFRDVGSRQLVIPDVSIQFIGPILKGHEDHKEFLVGLLRRGLWRHYNLPPQKKKPSGWEYGPRLFRRIHSPTPLTPEFISNSWIFSGSVPIEIVVSVLCWTELWLVASSGDGFSSFATDIIIIIIIIIIMYST